MGIKADSGNITVSPAWAGITLTATTIIVGFFWRVGNMSFASRQELQDLSAKVTLVQNDVGSVKADVKDIKRIFYPDSIVRERVNARRSP